MTNNERLFTILCWIYYGDPNGDSRTLLASEEDISRLRQDTARLTPNEALDRIAKLASSDDVQAVMTSIIGEPEYV